MKPLTTAFILVFVLLLVGCSGIKISGVDKQPGFAITNYKTFGFHEVEAGGTGLAENFRDNLPVLKDAIKKQMALKGLTHTQSSPDLIVNIGVLVEEKVQTRTTSFGNPGDRRMSYMGARNYSWQSQEVPVGTYREGTVKVDLVDKNTFKLVWTGAAESVLPEKSKNLPAVIDEGMEKLFAEL